MVMMNFWMMIAALGALALTASLMLGYASRRRSLRHNPPSVEQLEDLLPQTQCRQCGYAGCRPYAEAMIQDGEQINKCVPGGEPLMHKLAEQMNVEPQPLPDDAMPGKPERQVARIDESRCIGCTKCIQACPVDAIVGAARAMHTVVSELCTGCNLCVSPCPTDCIALDPVKPTPDSWNWDLNTIPVRVLQRGHHV